MGKKITTEEIREELEEKFPNRYDFSKMVYTNKSHPLTVVCKECGEIITLPIQALRARKQSCLACGEPTGTGLTRDEAIQRIEAKWENKFDFTKMVYVDNSTHMDLICKDCGEITTINLSSILHRKIPCHSSVGKEAKRTWSLAEMQSWTKENRPDYSVLSSFRKNVTENNKGDLFIWVQCPNSNHEAYSTRWHSFKAGCGCFLCNKGTRWDIEAMTREFAKYDLTILPTNKKINSYTYTSAITKEGYLVKSTPKALQEGVTPCILTKNPDAIHNIKLWTKLNRPDYKLLSTEYSGDVYKDMTWKYIGTEDLKGVDPVFRLSLTRFMHTRTNHPSLSKTKSKAELNTKRFLEENIIEFEEEKAFSDCRDKQALNFDFYINTNFGKTLIELQGRQHYESIEWFGGEINFKSQKRRDKIKVDYCRKENIPLLIIPYWEFDNLEDILDSYLNTGKSYFLLD